MIVTQNLNRILIYAQDEAERLQSGKVDTGHFMLAILRLVECTAYDLLLRAKFKPEEAKAYFDQALQGEQGALRVQERTSRADRVLRIAEGISREYKSEIVGSVHLLLAIVREELNPVAAYLEETWGINYPQLVELYGQPHHAQETPMDSADSMDDLEDGDWQAQKPLVIKGWIYRFLGHHPPK